MKLVNAELLLDIDLEENRPAVLVIENPKIMTEIVRQFYELCMSGEGDFILSENGKELFFEKAVEIIVNPFSIDFNSKKIQSKLYGELLEAESCYSDEKALLQTAIINYLDKLIHDVPYEMISNELDLDSMRLFKMYEVRIEPQCNSLLETLVEYTKVLARLLKKKLLIFINISAYLDADEIKALQEICVYQKMKILYVECKEQYFEFPKKSYIIDKDKCMIINEQI